MTGLARGASAAGAGGLGLAGVYASYGPTAVLTGVDLHVDGGGLTVLVGASGSGKTTVLRVLAGFERPSAGRVLVGDRVVDGERAWVPPQRRHLGWVAQDGALFPHLDVSANVGFGLPRRRRRQRRVDDLIEMVGLAPYAHRYPHQLSGGQQQRVALARALAVEPAAVLLDEPFSSLDPSLRAQVRADVLDVLRRADTTALLVSHDRDEALSVGDRIAVLSGGRIAATGLPADLYDAPPDVATATFLGDANLVAGTATDTRTVTTAFGPLALHPAARVDPGRPATVLLRPEQLRRAGADRSDQVPAVVAAADYRGHTTLLRLLAQVAGCSTDLTMRAPGRLGVSPGDHLSVDATGPVMAWPGSPATPPAAAQP